MTTSLSAANSDLHKEGQSAARWRPCAELVLSGGGYSAADLQARFERPKNVQEMLQNLKLAGDQDWLLQPHFYDAETLLKFFNGTEVAWQEHKPDPLVKGREAIAVNLDSRVFPKMMISVTASCEVIPYRYPDGQAEKKASGRANMSIYGSRVPDMTLRVVRSVFGRETENTIDTGIDIHGYDYTPQILGRVIYENRAKQQLVGAAIGTTFVFALRPTPKPGEPRPSEIGDDDIVQAMTLTSERNQTLSN